MLCTGHVLSALEAIRAPVTAWTPRGAWSAAALALAACTSSLPGGSSTRSASYPQASIYELEPEFAGEWRGDIGGLPGVLTIGELDERAYFGSFVTKGTEYTLLLEHTYVTSEEGSEVPSNRTTFTWQDGLGSRGHGWLLINREDTALTGSFGYGAATEGLGAWSFVREDG
ncbi:hypothetical protein G6O69_18940 [Pseudenhygromyxa sp. WMMC2535]|uniref:hypothetical protein n=1 Tax=Pseudenhygromyxa sp. WMMC2535 TaxID=2712867 RepID=UPI0015959F42|nr:hypothetical protein [Pseudenhygromyxa sp. WMMC2535]NVB39928.1 hypothetical protein [Pseudenhygromyxa sp. WMMC2535]